MRKTLTYSSLLIVALFVVAAFLTAKTYTQLGIAAIIYPIFVLIAYKIFVKDKVPRIQSMQDKLSSIEVQLPPVKTVKKIEEAPHAKVEVADVDKRTFLKIVGAAGLSYFIFSILGQRVESLFSSKALNSGISPLGFAPKTKVHKMEI